MVEVVRYINESGKDVISEWLTELKDARTRAKIVARLDRLERGNFGDCKSLQEGVWELRINWGPGYRVYYGMIDQKCVLLLCGGDKSSQQSDIKRAIKYFNDYTE
jgi:putative addiction module killer protein